MRVSVSYKYFRYFPYEIFLLTVAAQVFPSCDVPLEIDGDLNISLNKLVSQRFIFCLGDRLPDILKDSPLAGQNIYRRNHAG